MPRRPVFLAVALALTAGAQARAVPTPASAPAPVPHPATGPAAPGTVPAAAREDPLFFGAQAWREALA